MKKQKILAMILAFLFLSCQILSTPSDAQKQQEEANVEPSAYEVKTLEIGSTMENPADWAMLVYVPAGEFVMGSEDGGSDERPVHSVYLDAFWIYQTKVTNAMYATFLNAEGNQTEGGVTWLDAGDGDVRIHQVSGAWQVDSGYEEHPAIEVSWYGAAAYCQWAGVRLPTEAEWEKAACGTEGNIYPWGDSWNSGLANASGAGDGYSGTSPAGSFPGGASPYGALDMAGNVWEWVADWYGGNYYQSSPNENPTGPESGRYRILRGGSWHVNPNYLRAANRHFHFPYTSHFVIGFRCAMSAEP
jgi:formylglycine-generating enzyme required for sulfatase activity